MRISLCVGLGTLALVLSFSLDANAYSFSHTCRGKPSKFSGNQGFYAHTSHYNHNADAAMKGAISAWNKVGGMADNLCFKGYTRTWKADNGKSETAITSPKWTDGNNGLARSIHTPCNWLYNGRIKETDIFVLNSLDWNPPDPTQIAKTMVG